MQYISISIAIMATVASAAPYDLQVRQATAGSATAMDAAKINAAAVGGKVGTVANEFVAGGCKPVVMLFARGSTETGNMVCIFLSSTRRMKLIISGHHLWSSNCQQFEN